MNTVIHFQQIKSYNKYNWTYQSSENSLISSIMPDTALNHGLKMKFDSDNWAIWKF